MYMNTNYSAFPNQTCDDVDECAVNNGGCGTGVTCVNTMVSYNTKSLSGQVISAPNFESCSLGFESYWR